MKFKKLFLWIHRYLGLATALILIIVAISGSVYSFQKQIRSVLYPELLYVKSSTISGSQDIDSLVRSAERAYPQSAIRELIVDADPTKTVRVYTWDLHLLYMNPYNGEVVGIKNQQKDPFLLAWLIHTQLGLGKFGGRVVALATLLAVPLILTGIVLWWPRNRKLFWTALKPSKWRTWKAINFNLHKTGGFYSSIILLFVVLTGLMMSYVWFKDSVYFITGSPVVEKVAPLAIKGTATSHPINTAVDYVRKNYLEFQECSVNYPYGEDKDVFTFRVNHNDKIGTTHLLHFNLSNGQLVKEKPYSEFSTGDRINAINYNIHSGRVFGILGIIIVFLVTLFSAFLAVSGFTIWFNRTIKKKKKMKNKAILSILMVMLGSNMSFAQDQKQDTLAASQLELREVVVTATRTSKIKEDVPIPVKVVKGQEIRDKGMMRLGEVLAEQTGLQLYSDNLASGVQMQGMDAKYTLILIDGEPLIGRIAGILELSRVNVANIDRIEIIKGPSSSLYGSDAMAGVINIITKKPPMGTSAETAIRYGTYNTREINVDGGFRAKNISTALHLNTTGINGYTRNIGSKTSIVPPNHGNGAMFTTKWQFAPKSDAQVSFRYSDQMYKEDYQLSFNQAEGSPQLKDVNSHEVKKDISILPTFSHQFSDRNRSTLRLNKTWYRKNSTINMTESGSLYNTDYFNQDFAGAELQHDFEMNSNVTLTGGLGYQLEGLKANRYEGDKDFNSQYVYGQVDWKPAQKLSVLAGARFDTHNIYGSQFSPKVALGYNINRFINLTGSIGRGFKAPDFRELYLNFLDPNYGYSVYGTEEVDYRVQVLKDQGQLGELLVDLNNIKTLDAERSLSYNLGLTSNTFENFQVAVNGFYNNVDNLIESVLIGRKTDGKAIYTYNNQQKVNVRGMDVDFSYRHRNLFFKTGMQYLLTENVEVVEKLKAGDTYFTKDEVSGDQRPVRLSEYGGLLNRSTYTTNASVSYHEAKSGINGTLRWVYRSRYGLIDNDRNGILNGNDEYAKGYSLINASLSKSVFKQALRIQVTGDNIFNFNNTDNLALPGRLVYLGLYYQVVR